jgi:hypothetical protein
VLGTRDRQERFFRLSSDIGLDGMRFASGLPLSGGREVWVTFRLPEPPVALRLAASVCEDSGVRPVPRPEDGEAGSGPRAFGVEFHALSEAEELSIRNYIDSAD